MLDNTQVVNSHFMACLLWRILACHRYFR